MLLYHSFTFCPFQLHAPITAVLQIGSRAWNYAIVNYKNRFLKTFRHTSRLERLQGKSDFSSSRYLPPLIKPRKPFDFLKNEPVAVLQSTKQEKLIDLIGKPRNWNCIECPERVLFLTYSVVDKEQVLYTQKGILEMAVWQRGWQLRHWNSPKLCVYVYIYTWYSSIVLGSNLMP